MIAFYQRNENVMLPGKQLNKVSSVFKASLISLKSIVHKILRFTLTCTQEAQLAVIMYIILFSDRFLSYVL